MILKTTTTLVFVVALAAALSQTSSIFTTACPKDLQMEFITLRDYYRYVAMPHADYDSFRRQAAERLHIDIDDYAEITRLACELIDAGSIEDVTEMLDLGPHESSSVAEMFGGIIFTFRKEIEAWPRIELGYDAAARFVFAVDLLSFPLNMTEAEALELVKDTGAEALGLFFDNEPSAMEMEMLAKAMAQASNDAEFNYITQGRFAHTIEDRRYTRGDFIERYNDVTQRPGLQKEFLAVLEKYGLSQKFHLKY